MQRLTQRSSCSNILQILPLEVLQLVFEEKARHCARLRLVCKAINDIVEPHVFSTITIDLRLKSLDILREMLSTLAVNAGPYPRWAKRLKLHDAEFKIGTATYDYCKSQLLIPSIRALINVEEVQATIISEDEQPDSVTRALSELPRLQTLRLTLPKFGSLGPGLFENFSNLRTIKLENLSLVPSSLEGAMGMITRSPKLFELNIRLWARRKEGAPATEFSVLVEDAIHSPTFVPTLKKLTVVQAQIGLTPSCVPFLAALTHLHVYNNRAAVPSPVWIALQRRRIQLQSLKVYRLDQPVVDYLTSYSGIEELLIERCISTDESLFYLVYHQVLPKHKNTLQSFTIYERGIGPWCITGPNLRQICLCPNIRRLKLAYYLPSPKGTAFLPVIPLVDLFSSLAQSLPHLRKLYFKIAGRQTASTHKLFIPSMLKTMFLSPGTVPSFTLAHDCSRFNPVAVLDDLGAVILGQYRFKAANEADRIVKVFGAEVSQYP